MVITMAHVESGWWLAGILTKALPISLFKRRRKELMNLCNGAWLHMCGKLTS